MKQEEKMKDKLELYEKILFQINDAVDGKFNFQLSEKDKESLYPISLGVIESILEQGGIRPPSEISISG